MSAGNLIFLLVLVGGAFAMFSMHRGGSHSHGMGGGCGAGHGHGHGSSDSHGSPEDLHDEEKQPPRDKPVAHAREHEPAAEGGRHGGH